MTRHQPLPADDVAEARRLALDLEAGDPTFEHYSTDGADTLLWVVVLIVIIAVLGLAVLALLVFHLGPHWRGATQAALITGMGLGFLRGTR
ncbi:MAG: hypothetical protein ABI047_10570 [Jatrophihabitantaceae bacterium]